MKWPVRRELDRQLELLFVDCIGCGNFIDGVRDLDGDVLVLASEFLRYARVLDTL